MAAPKGNKYGSKPADKKATAFIQMRCLPSDKEKWELKAEKKKMSLTAWIIEKLNAE